MHISHVFQNEAVYCIPKQVYLRRDIPVLWLCNSGHHPNQKEASSQLEGFAQ